MTTLTGEKVSGRLAVKDARRRVAASPAASVVRRRFHAHASGMDPDGRTWGFVPGRKGREKAIPGLFSFQYRPNRTVIPVQAWNENGPLQSSRNGSHSGPFQVQPNEALLCLSFPARNETVCNRTSPKCCLSHRIADFVTNELVSPPVRNDYYSI